MVAREILCVPKGERRQYLGIKKETSQRLRQLELRECSAATGAQTPLLPLPIACPNG